jgi:hypothetical protein
MAQSIHTYIHTRNVSRRFRSTGQLFVLCIVLAAASCMFSVANAVLAGSQRPVPPCLQRLVVAIAPIFCFGEPVPTGQRECSCSRRRYSWMERSGLVPSAPTYDCRDGEQNIMDYPAATIPSANAREAQESSVLLRKGHTGSLQAGQVQWSMVSTLADRLFFLIHALACVCTFVGYILFGYLPWLTYEGISLNETDWMYLCSQLRFQHVEDAQGIAACHVALSKLDSNN